LDWKFNNDSPVYQQIIEQIKAMLATGALKAGDKIPSVRELAIEAEVNPNTMQKALSELERTGLVYSQRTSGRFITRDTAMIYELKEKQAREVIASFLAQMNMLGFREEEAIALITETIREETK